MKPPASFEIRPPTLPMRPRQETVQALANDAEYVALSLTRCDLSGQAAEGIVFDQVALRHTSLARTRLTRLLFSDVRAEVSDFSGADWQKARLRRVEFVGCRLLGILWPEAQLEDVLFKDCNLESAVLASAALKRVRFEACTLREAQCDGADLSHVFLGRCDLTGADLRGATLRGADLRGAAIEGLRVTPRDMQGAIVDPSQAVQIAGLFGLTVQPEEAE